MNRFVIRQSFLLLMTAFIWGIAFVAQSAGMDYVEPLTFNAIRCFLGGIVLLPLVLYRNKKEKGTTVQNKKTLFCAGILCGVLLCLGSNLQQIGIKYTTVGKAGFITALYIVIIPLLGIFMRKRIQKRIWIAVAIAICGLYLLCISEQFSVQKGDIYMLLCAVAFSFHILTVNHYSGRVDGVKLSCIQFFTCGTISFILMFIFETPRLSLIIDAWLPIAYAGFLSCGIAYTLQIIGQRGMNPTTASLILSLESVFAVLAGWIILHQTLSVKEILGCIFMFVAIVIAQLPQKKKSLVMADGGMV